MTENIESNVLNSEEAAEYGRVGVKTIRDAIKSGELEGRIVGGSNGFLTTKEAVERWVKKGNKSARSSSTE